VASANAPLSVALPIPALRALATLIIAGITPHTRETLVDNRWWKYLATLVAAALAVVLTVSAVSAEPRRSSKPDAQKHEAVMAASTRSCGGGRWSVKTGTDSDVGLVNLESTTPTTIAALTALPVPGTLPENNRVRPTETTVFQLNAILDQYELEADSDYHLVLDDKAGHTMIAEIPDPACVGASSPLRPSINNSRAEFDATYTPTRSFQNANVPVTITGVGFFDFLHGQTGVAPNGIELHAVLDVQFGTGTGDSVSVAGPGDQSATIGPAAGGHQPARRTPTRVSDAP
jgi:hypothetical protein